MRGNDEVIAELNEALREELTAINQYFIHAEMCHNWGYHKLGSYIRKQSIDEMKHAEQLIERMLFLDGTPKMEYLDLNIGGNVKGSARGRSEARSQRRRACTTRRSTYLARTTMTRRASCFRAPQGRRGARRLARSAAPQIKEMGYERYLSNPGRGGQRVRGRHLVGPLTRLALIASLRR